MTERAMIVEGNDTSCFIGVDPEYMNYANETERPLMTDVEQWELTDNLSHLEGNLDVAEEAPVVSDEEVADTSIGDGEETKNDAETPVVSFGLTQVPTE